MVEELFQSYPDRSPNNGYNGIRSWSCTSNVLTIKQLIDARFRQKFLRSQKSPNSPTSAAIADFNPHLVSLDIADLQLHTDNKLLGYGNAVFAGTQIRSFVRLSQPSLYRISFSKMRSHVLRRLTSAIAESPIKQRDRDIIAERSLSFNLRTSAYG